MAARVAAVRRVRGRTAICFKEKRGGEVNIYLIRKGAWHEVHSFSAFVSFPSVSRDSLGGRRVYYATCGLPIYMNSAALGGVARVSSEHCDTCILLWILYLILGRLLSCNGYKDGAFGTVLAESLRNNVASWYHHHLASSANSLPCPLLPFRETCERHHGGVERKW